MGGILNNADALTDAAQEVHYSDPRVRRLAEARHRLGGNASIPFGVLVHEKPELIEQARDWLRAAVAAGLIPADPGPAPVLDPDGPLTQLLDHDLAMVFVPKNAQVTQVTQAGNLSDLRQPFAEALAEAFTRPMPKLVKGRPTDEIADPHPGDRVDRTMSVQFTAGDGYPSFRMVTCMEAAEVCAAVRDEEMAALRQEVEQLRVAASPLKAAAAGRLVASATSLVRIERNDARQRADRAEAHALRLRQAVTILRAALRHDTPCNGPSPDVDPCGACVAIEYLAGAAIDEPEVEGEPQETRNPGERPSERLPGPLHSPTGPRETSVAEAADGEVCGDDCPRLIGQQAVTCTLPKGHATHRSGGTAWTLLCDEAHQRLDQAEAANTRVRELHARDDTSPHGPWCGTCMTAWPCATWAALDGEENQP
jgi:hypothetical protein